MLGGASDAVLARRTAAGDRQAFRALYERHARRVFLLARQRLGDEGAGDVGQDVFMTVWEEAHQFDEQRGAFQTWMTAIARHRILDLARRGPADVRTLSVEDVAAQVERLVDDGIDVAGAVIASEQSARLVATLSALPPPQRRALLLIYFGGYSHRELAELLDWPLGTVKKRVRLGLHKLGMQLDHIDAESFPAAEEATYEL